MGGNEHLTSNPDDGHHSSRPATFLAMRKENIRAARGAEVRHLDFRVHQSCASQLVAGHSGKVQVYGGDGFRSMARRLLGEE